MERLLAAMGEAGIVMLIAVGAIVFGIGATALIGCGLVVVGVPIGLAGPIAIVPAMFVLLTAVSLVFGD